MTICYFGIYNPDYPRNRLFIKGLRENSTQVVECNARGKGIWKYIKLVFCHFKIQSSYDVMIVGFPGQTVMQLARKLTRKPIVFDAFLSLYDSEVYDRKLVEPDSKKAFKLFMQDKKACELADRVLVDTSEHLEYFVSKFKLGKEKFRVIPVGTDDSVFFPGEKKSAKFIVHVHGKYIPLQGIEHIVGAAELLKDQSIKFRIVGRGQEYDEITQLIKQKSLSNIEQIGMVPYEKLADYINDSDVCLGIFGNSDKTQRVIPNKVVEYLACGKAVITSDSPAAREFLTDGENVRFCESANSKDLAGKILELYNDNDLRNKLGKSARELYLKKLASKILVTKLKSILYELDQRK